MVWCLGMQTITPQEYLTLPTGYESNYALQYRGQALNMGSLTTCSPRFTWLEVSVWPEWGRSKFARVRLDPASLSIVTTDTTFTVTEAKAVPFGSAGDCYSEKKACPPKGEFSIDLTGTPFTLANENQWRTVAGGVVDIKVADDRRSAVGNCGGNKACGGGCSIDLVRLQFVPAVEDVCNSNPCANNGVCVDGTAGFLCLCTLGYAGSTCTETVG